MTKTPPTRAVLAAAAAVLLALALGGAVRAAASAAPSNTAPPTISGTPQVGKTLTASNGTWTNSPTSYMYQWKRCNTSGASCVNVANGTNKTYTLVGADAGHTMRVVVTASNADGSASATSAQTATVAANAAAPKNTSLPTITGTPKVGESLTASQGTWSGNPTSYSYQWQRCDADTITCFDVPGATGATYNVAALDEGFRLRVVVTAKNAKGSASAASNPTDIVQPAVTPRNHRPTIRMISARFVGAAVYVRFRICDDSFKNLTILATDSRPGKASYTRRFSTLVAPSPCGVYTRHWVPVARFRGRGRYTVTLRARDKSGLTSNAVHHTFSRG
jgi:hypothetical protein